MAAVRDVPSHPERGPGGGGEVVGGLERPFPRLLELGRAPLTARMS
ncbi:hypothetical protein ACIQWZ_33090 [Streptomyces sp. NPDC098077]